MVGDKYLVRVELNLVALEVEIALHLREIEYSGEVERIVDVEVNPEQRVVVHREEGVVELLIVVVL